MTVSMARPVAQRARSRASQFLVALQALLLSTLLAACGGGGGGTSPPPQVAITTQPADAHVTAGQAATFSVVVTGSVTYRWQTGGPGGWTDISGAAGASYTLTPSTLSSGAQYRVIVASTANAAVTATSSAATLTVDPAPVAVSIQQQPQLPGTLYEGQQVTLSVTAGGTAPAYRWQRSGDHGATWVDLVGASGPSVMLQPLVADDGEQVRVVVSNTLGQQTSDSVTLAVRPAPAVPLFTTRPSDVVAPVGQAASFDAVAVGDPTPTLQWQTAFESNGPWTDIAGATGGTYIITATAPADDGRLVRAVATNANGSAVVSAALAISAGSLAPGFSEEPADATLSAGTAAQFTARGYGAPSVTYQWQVSTDGGASFGNVNGATTRFYTTSPLVLGDDGKRVRVVVSNNLGSATSHVARLTVQQFPSIDTFSLGEHWRPGVTGAYLVAGASGSQLGYQWQLGVSANGAASDVPGATARDFVVPASTPANIDQVCVTVRNLVGSVHRCVPLVATTWRALRPQTLNGMIRAIAGTGGTTAVAGGSNGQVIRTTDAGVTWSVVSEASWAEYTISSIAMRGQHGVAVGGAETRYTADGGQHWFSGPSDGFFAEAVAYAPDGTLVKVGGKRARVSADDGVTWREATVDTGFSELWGLAFNANGVGIAVGVGVPVTNRGNTGAIARSTDNGATWSTVLTPDVPVSGLAFLSDSVIVCVDWDGNAWRSTDAGATWTARATGNPSLFTIGFQNANVGVGYGGDGRLFRTTDGGLTWGAVGPQMNMQAIVALDANTLLAGGTGGTPLRSLDGGLTWTAQGRGDAPTLLDTVFLDASTGVAVGTGGTIERTTDGAATWTTVPSGVAAGLSHVRFGDAIHGLAVGSDGTVLRTSDAGASWQLATSPSPWSLSSVAYATPTLAFVASGDGLWKTSNAGATWQQVADLGNAVVNLVRFGDALHGLATTQDRKLWRTSDGGQTWSGVTTNFDGQNNPVDGLLDLVFVTPTTVVGVAGGNLTVRSTDGGVTWQSNYSGLAAASRVFFRDAQVGVIVGSGILRTTDGGLTWNWDMGATPFAGLMVQGGIAAVGAHSMIVVGSSDQIYRNDGF